MIRAFVLTPWTGEGKLPANSYRPLVAAAYPLSYCGDAAGQTKVIPEPNLLLAEIHCDESTYAALEADRDPGTGEPRFFVLECEEVR